MGDGGGRKMKRPSMRLLNVFVTAAAALVWTVYCAVLLDYAADNPLPEGMRLLTVLCAAIWWVRFAAAYSSR